MKMIGEEDGHNHEFIPGVHEIEPWTDEQLARYRKKVFGTMVYPDEYHNTRNGELPGMARKGEHP